MIHLCTCTGGSASTINSSRRRGGTVSCKNCGGRPAIDGKSSSSCLLSTVLELTSLINSDFTWTKVSKGCRSSSRRPRRSNSNTINLACRELLTKDSKGLEMPVSESEKLGVSVLGCHFSEKAEHIPIKKRRFLFRASSPPRNTSNPSLEGAERHGTSAKASSHELQLYPNANCLPATSEAISGMFDKVDEKELMKDDDFSGISILAAAACSNCLGAEPDHCEKSHEVPKTVEFNVNNVKNEELDFHTSTTPSKDDESALNDSSSHAPLESACSKTNEEPNIHKSPVRDVRFSWDLNTTMDAWEEPFVSEHEISASGAANDNATFLDEKKDCTKDYSRSSSKGISNQNLPVELKSLGHENKTIKVGKFEPPSSEFDSAQHAVVVKTESTDGANDVIPVTRTLSLENTTHGIFSKWSNLCGQSSVGFSNTEAVDTKLSMDRCSIPPGFDPRLNLGVPKENVGVSFTSVDAGNNVNFLTTTTTTAQTVMNKQELSLITATSLENGAHQSGVTFNIVDEAMTKMELTTANVIATKDLASKEQIDSKVVEDQHQPAAISSLCDPTAHSDAVNGFGYDNSQSDNRAGSGIDKLDEVSVGDDSQYEDGELRESSTNAWKGYQLTVGKENEYDTNNREEEEEEEEKDGFNLGAVDHCETSSQNGQEGSSGIIKLTKTGSEKEADVTKSSVLLPEKLQTSDKVEVSGSEPTEMVSGQEKSERQDVVMQQQHVTQSDEWRMNVSGWDILPENQRISSNDFTKTRNFTGRRFSYREERKDGFDTDDVEMKADDGSRFYRKESLTRIGGSSTRDTFLNRGRYQMHGCSSSKAADGLNCRPERESGVRSFGRGGRYSPHSRPTGRGVGMWNHSPERGWDLKRLPSPSYQGGQSFLRSMLEDSGTVDDMTIEGGGMDPSDDIAGRHNNNNNASSYVTTRRPFRSRSPMDREANEFRARLGFRRTGDTSHDRLVNLGRGRGRGRSVRYSTTRLDGEGPRGRFHGPASDECDEFLNEYSHPFPRRRRCFSPIERRGGNNTYQHHHSDSRSPTRPRTRSPIALRRRSRSPYFRPDARIRRPRSPNYRDHLSEYNSGSRNNNPSPPSSRWVSYKERSAFDRRSPPPHGRTDGPQGERFSFYDSSRKTKQNEFYRSGHPGRFSDLSEGGRGRPRYVDNDGSDRADNSYRRGGFVRRYNMDGPARRFQYDDEDGFGRGFDARDRHVLELHARTNTNPKPCSDGTDSRFRDFPRRHREDGGDLKRRSRDGKDLKEDSEHMGDDIEKRPREVKDQSTTTTTTNLV